MSADAARFGQVALLLGGQSAEREISLKSGQAVLAALQRRGVAVTPIDPAPQVLAQLAEAGVRVRQLDVIDHPQDEQLNVIVVQTEPTQLRLLRVATAALETLPSVMGFAKTIRMECLA